MQIESSTAISAPAVVEHCSTQGNRRARGRWRAPVKAVVPTLQGVRSVQSKERGNGNSDQAVDVSMPGVSGTDVDASAKA